MPAASLTRAHRQRLTQVWRSAGWPCRDGIELDLLAAGLLSTHTAADGRDTLRVTDAGLQALAQARERGRRALSPHDRLALRFGEQLMAEGRIVWHELSLRARVERPGGADDVQPRTGPPTLWDDGTGSASTAAGVWRMARPDLFSVRHTTVEAYLQPMVHEVKATRADLLSDLRHVAKRDAYRWLCSECHYVFPAGTAEPEEIPEDFGVWVHHGPPDAGRFERLRPARHVPCTLPFAVWLALARSTPMRSEAEGAQGLLGARPDAAD